MNGNVEMEYKKMDIENYISDILTLGLCKLFLPVNFIILQDKINANYKTLGYRKVAAINTIGTEDILNIIISILQGMNSAEKHYIFFDEYELNDEIIYVDKGFTTCKIIFVPSHNEETGLEKILTLMEQLKSKGNEEGIKYIDNAMEYIKTSGFSYSRIIHQLEELRKEVYLCDIE